MKVRLNLKHLNKAIEVNGKPIPNEWIKSISQKFNVNPKRILYYEFRKK